MQRSIVGGRQKRPSGDPVQWAARPAHQDAPRTPRGAARRRRDPGLHSPQVDAPKRAIAVFPVRHRPAAHFFDRYETHHDDHILDLRASGARCRVRPRDSGAGPQGRARRTDATIAPNDFPRGKSLGCPSPGGRGARSEEQKHEKTPTRRDVIENENRAPRVQARTVSDRADGMKQDAP